MGRQIITASDINPENKKFRMIQRSWENCEIVEYEIQYFHKPSFLQKLFRHVPGWRTLTQTEGGMSDYYETPLIYRSFNFSTHDSVYNNAYKKFCKIVEDEKSKSYLNCEIKTMAEV